MSVSPETAGTAASTPVGIEARQAWRAVFASLAAQLRREQLRTWFHRVGAVEFDGHLLSLAVPSEFHRDWILSNYLEALQESCRNALGAAVRVRLVIDPERASSRSDPEARALTTEEAAEPAAPEPARRTVSAPARAPEEQIRAFSGNPAYSFESFVVGPCNRFAVAGAMGVAENPSKAYNPLFLHGSVGLGKTHLLQAVCHEILRRRPSTRILYLSCETFTNHFIAALEKGALEEFRRRYRGVDILVVDDIHFLANKERTQEEFFHTFNALFHDEKQIVLSSDSPAKEIPTLQERLVSRFKCGLEAEIEKPCFETRLAILGRKARTLNVSLGDDVAHFLAERITNNIRELEGAINRVVGFSALQKQPISLDLVRSAMPELEADRSTLVRFEDVSLVVARKYHVKVLDLQSRRRHQSIAFPRQIAMFLARRHTKHSLEEIGAYFGGRDHTTVLYGVEKIADLLEKDVSLREAINGLTEEIGRSSLRSA